MSHLISQFPVSATVEKEEKSNIQKHVQQNTMVTITLTGNSYYCNSITRMIKYLKDLKLVLNIFIKLSCSSDSYVQSQAFPSEHDLVSILWSQCLYRKREDAVVTKKLYL